MDTKRAAPLAQKETLNNGDETKEIEIKLININLRGTIFQLETKTISQLPVKSTFNTQLQKRYGITVEDFQKDNIAFEYLYINRNPRLFHCILDYIDTNDLHFPHNVCTEAIHNEMQFWGLPEKALSQCCWERLETEAKAAKKSQEIARRWRWLENSRKIVTEELPSGTLSYKTPIREHIRLFLEDCGSSVFAKIWGIFLTIVIVTSLATLILETEHSLRTPPYDEVVAHTNLTEGEGVYEYYTVNSVAAPWVGWIDFTCLCILSVEYLVRFLVSYRKCLFLLHPLNITDLLGILPMWVLFGVSRYRAGSDDLFSDGIEKTITVLAIMRLFRILRFVRLMTYSKQLKIIHIAVMTSYREIVILASLMAILSITFGSAMYYAEMKVDNFESILIGQWWAIVTMTTVGYGDYFPKTEIGYLIGILCSLTGIVHIALATTVIVNNFIVTSEGVEKCIRHKRRTDDDVKASHIWGSRSSVSPDVSDIKSDMK